MISDHDFIKSSTVPGPTKEEIRCLVLCKSQLSSQDIVVDIGCGTGGLTLEFAKRTSQVYSLDRNPEAINLTSKNLEKHGLKDRVRLICGDAKEEMDKLPDFNVLMIGGSGGDLDLLIEKGYNKLKNNGRIIITAILLETALEAIEKLKKFDMDMEVINASISRGKIIERGTMMLAENPITLVMGVKRNYH